MDPDFSTEGVEFDDLDFSGFEAQGDNVQAEVPEVPETPTEGAPAGVNPAWSEYLEKVPESLRPLVTPAFETWDRSVQDRFNQLKQQYEPWNRFQERKIDPEYLDKAYGVAQRLQEDPVGLYQSLHQYFQQSPQHMQQLRELGLIPAEPAQQQTPLAPDGNLAPEDPIASLQQEIQQLKEERLREIQEAQVAERFNQEYETTLSAIESDFQAIEQRAGKPVPNNIRAEIIKHAQFMGLQEQRYVSVVEAAPHVFRFMQQARAGIKAAPRPVGSGSVPQSAQFDPTTATDAERAARIAQIVQQHAEN